MSASKTASWLPIAFALIGSLAYAQPPGPTQPAPAPAPGGPGGPGGPAPAARPDGPDRRCPDGADLADVLARVAESTGRKFIVDPRVRACVTLVPAQPNLSYADLFTILRVHGYTAVEIGGFVNVIPDALARAMPFRLVQRDDNSIPDDQWVTRILTVNGNAPQLVSVLRPMMPQSAHLAASVDLNKIIIVDTYANVRRMTEVIRSLTQ